MRFPEVVGEIERRILVNFRVDPQIVSNLLPAPFRPQLVGGFAVAGICLIRLGGLRPRLSPFPWGLGSENAAHRFAVEWDDGDTQRTGVYIPRRDTSSRMNTMLGGRVFPGLHHLARFNVSESAHRLAVQFASRDGLVSAAVAARVSDRVPTGSVFATVDEASAFFQSGSLGYSPSRCPECLEGLELRCETWHIEPLEVATVSSSWFDDPSQFPPGSIHFDSAFLIRSISHSWVGRPVIQGARLTALIVQ